MSVEVEKFKGYPIIRLIDEKTGRYFAFSHFKAKMILAHIKEIEEFVKKYDKEAKK